jgi:hypothetical protein
LGMDMQMGKPAHGVVPGGSFGLIFAGEGQISGIPDPEPT